MTNDALATRLRTTFVGELEEQVKLLNADLLALEGGLADEDRLRSVFRITHTLKGAARAARLPLIEQVCHALETRLAERRDAKTALRPADITLLFAGADALADAAQRLHAGVPLDASPLATLGVELRVRGSVPTAPTPPTGPSARPVADDPAVRVDAERLDALLASTGQLMTSCSRLSARPGDLEELRAAAFNLAADWRRVRREVRRALHSVNGGDPESSLERVDKRVRWLTHEADRLAALVTNDVRHLAQVTDRVVGEVRRARLLSFADASEALPRAVRDRALAAGKEVKLEIGGAGVEADRAVLDGLREALLHLVGNAVDHGIEAPAERERREKDRKGRIRVAAAIRGNRIAVTVADDGGGLDVGAIRDKLRQQGIADPPAASELAGLLLRGGLSTRAEASPISGRGVGLDLVRAAVEKIRGTLSVDWVEGQGTTFTVTCPPSLATLSVLLLGVGDEILALPVSEVERVARVPIGALQRAGGREVITQGGVTVSVAPLGRVLGRPEREQPPGAALLVVTLKLGEERVGLAVDDVMREEEIVLRPIRAGSSPQPLLMGAALLGSGRVVLVLDPGAILSTALRQGAALAPERPAVPLHPPRRRVLVVDDSITTRTLEQSLLEAAGYEVITAADGAQAWKLLQQGECALVVTDIEMPRMDGIALCEAIRGSRTHAELPVVLVTALDSAADRARGLEAGADAYLPKTNFDHQSLLDTIRQLLD